MLRPALATLIAVGPLAMLLGQGGCSGNCCALDGFPLVIQRAPLNTLSPAAPGALLADARGGPGGDAPFKMLIDTGTPLTLFAGGSGQSLQVASQSFQLFDATPAAPQRARFGDITSLQLPLQPVGNSDATVGGVLGADLLGAFSVQLRLAAPCSSAVGDAGAVATTSAACPTMTFWNYQGASDGFLADAGFAVLPFTPSGGGEVSVRDRNDFLGLSGPLHIGPTRIVVRTCAAPQTFDPTLAPQACCTAREALAQASGTDLSLLLATGVGPLVLARSAWQRLMSNKKMPLPDATTPGKLLLATWPEGINAVWTTIPRLALVNQEVSSNDDPGPCVELARARRIELVARSQQQNHAQADCFQPCDADVRENSKAQNSAAYLEVGGAIPVAVIDDSERWLQGLRLEVRPEGPELDGVLGAAALGLAQVEIDYRSKPRRLIFSCEGAARDACWAAGRCTRLPDQSQQHLCFGLPAHGLPQKCVPSGCPVQ
jgi:hypothetical protein